MNPEVVWSRPEGLSQNVKIFMIPCLEWEADVSSPNNRVASEAAKKDEDVLRVLC